MRGARRHEREDIEGGELDAVIGSPDTFKSGRVKALILKAHPTVLSAQGKRVEGIAGFLARCGYVLDAHFSQLAVWRWPASNTNIGSG
jgi:hypothetical protein